MISAEGERIPLSPPVMPDGNVEDWMMMVENSMQNTVRETIGRALENLNAETIRKQWVLEWPGQVVIAGSQTFWTADVTLNLQNKTLAAYLKYMLSYVSITGIRNLASD